MFLRALTAKKLFCLVQVKARVNRWHKLIKIRLLARPLKEPSSTSLNCFNLTGHSLQKCPFDPTAQAPVVPKLDSTIHRINRYPVDNAIGFPNRVLTLIHWIVIYPVDNAIQLLNNWGQVLSTVLRASLPAPSKQAGKERNFKVQRNKISILLVISMAAANCGRTTTTNINNNINMDSTT